MNLEMALLLESRVTQAALKRPLPGLNAKVALALALAPKGPIADRTREAFEGDFHRWDHWFVKSMLIRHSGFDEFGLSAKVILCHLKCSFRDDVAEYRQLELVNDF
eukprot:CAMPEP_0170176442 /NCGR_PEP_ID=MMETSP0040_2-20121228/9312_1 /TAXON_ID=641309 /ORGANISM="Lotharella oceanica, Strain CCMP622" /LENGTH=105 /DNA_ID=CAMNT_0010418765 /DNA_START=784 /DNA_END=1101 /DNA_ORIENTATION=+